MASLDIIGKGWSFPIRVTPGGSIAMSTGQQRIEDAIWIIVSTSLGERLMRPNFGAGANDYVFQPNSPLIRAQLAHAVQDALVQWEPRIELQSVSVDPSPDQDSQVLITIYYQIRSTNELFNMVFPFYLQEGAT